MAVLSILRYPSPRLRARSSDVEVIDDDLRRLVTEMTEAMYAANGAGLAAVQVGQPVRLFIVDGPVVGRGEDAPPVAFINPRIVEASDDSQTGDEGCLSFPGIFVPVKRHLRVRVRATSLDREDFEMEATELFARAIQHEMDHLEGKLLIDQVGPVKREIIKRKLRKDAEADAAEAAG